MFGEIICTGILLEGRLMYCANRKNNSVETCSKPSLLFIVDP
jgi:hypothetical protein